jgi:ankyrin repeat protein
MPSIFTKLSAALLPANDVWRAAKLGDVTAIRRLVAGGADVNAKKHTLNVEGDTALHIAARHDQTEAIKVLVELGAKVNAKDDHGGTPLMEASGAGAGEATINALIDLGANIDSQDRYGLTALSWAAAGGHENVVALLLAKGAKPNQEKGRRKSEVLSKAIEGKNPKVFQMLLAAGAKPGGSGDVSPAIQTAAIYGLPDYVECLLKAGADPNTKDDSGFPTTMAAVRGKSLEVLQLLIDAGADVNALDSTGETALDIACEIRRKDMIALLHRAGAKRGRELPTRDDKEEGTFWQLEDGSEFRVSVEPWPPKVGSATLKVAITSADPAQIPIWKVGYRITAEKGSNEPWNPMARVQEDEEAQEDEPLFEAAVQFRKGKWLIEFRVEGVWGDQTTELSDWEVQIE